MKIKELIGKDFPEIAAQLNAAAGDIDIAAITADSRQVVPGALFVALSGSKADGKAFIDDAIARGAAAVVAGAKLSNDASIPVFAASAPRRVLALAAANFYGRQPQTMVAVTGTAGKTSVASFTRQIWA
ncbi:MAG: Mur ligase domain-containing protein, partial [Rhizobium giardinii]